jgi:hypothetical protein
VDKSARRVVILLCRDRLLRSKRAERVSRHRWPTSLPTSLQFERKLMARSDVLGTADWAESNLDAPNIVFVEVDDK